MLKLSRAQYRVLEADTKKRWRERLMAWLREQAEEARAMDDAALHALMERQHHRAAAYGIKSEIGLAEWCYLAMTVGEDFDRMAKVDAFLRDPANGNPDRRIDTLLRSFNKITGGSRQ
jgi:hypothetical protein